MKSFQIIFDENFNLIGDSDTLDLDPRSFSQRLEIIEMNILNDELESTEEGSEFSHRQLQLRRPNIIDIVKRFMVLACIVLVLVLSLTPLVIYMTRSRRKEE